MRMAAWTLLAATLVFSTSHAQSLNYVTVGGQLVALQAPDGFVDPRKILPATARTIDAVTPADNRNLTYLVPREDVSRIEAQARVLKVEISRQSEDKLFSPPQFERFREELRAAKPPADAENLGIVDETPYSISRLTVGNGRVTAASLVYVQGKVLYVIASALGRDQDTVVWAQAMSHAFVRLILEANQQPVKN